MTPIEKLERLRDKAAARGDDWEALEMQKMIDDLESAIHCAGCGTILYLEVMQAGKSYTSAWVDYRGSTTHFNPDRFPLLASHAPEGKVRDA